MWQEVSEWQAEAQGALHAAGQVWAARRAAGGPEPGTASWGSSLGSHAVCVSGFCLRRQHKHVPHTLVAAPAAWLAAVRCAGLSAAYTQCPVMRNRDYRLLQLSTSNLSAGQLQEVPGLGF